MVVSTVTMLHFEGVILYKRFLFLVFVMLQVAGCTNNVEQEVSAESRVKTRAAERWQALIDGRLETAYTYEAPEYREVYTYKQFARKFHGGGFWTKAEVEDVSCKKDKCVATMRIYVTIRVGRGFGVTKANSLLKEQWIQDAVSGDWYHVSNQ